MFGNKNLNWQKQTFFFLGVVPHKGIMLMAPKWLAATLMHVYCICTMIQLQMFILANYQRILTPRRHLLTMLQYSTH